jgi:hypothetical protein
MTFWLRAFGFPCCHEQYARNYCAVLWNVGNEHEMRILMSMS